MARVDQDVPVRVFGLGTMEARVTSRIDFEVAGTLVAVLADRVAAGAHSRPGAMPRSRWRNLVNAVIARLPPHADPAAATAEIRRWKHFAALTAAEQEQVLTRSVVDRARKQLGLFTAVLLLVSAVIVALIIYTLTMDKMREIATPKLIGAPDATIVALVMQQAMLLGAAAGREGQLPAPRGAGTGGDRRPRSAGCCGSCARTTCWRPRGSARLEARATTTAPSSPRRWTVDNVGHRPDHHLHRRGPGRGVRRRRSLLGCAERFIRTLKESLLWVRTFVTVGKLRQHCSNSGKPTTPYG